MNKNNIWREIVKAIIEIASIVLLSKNNIIEIAYSIPTNHFIPTLVMNGVWIIIKMIAVFIVMGLIEKFIKKDRNV